MRRFAGTAMRLLLGTAAIVWLISRVDGEAAWNSVRHADLGWLWMSMLAQLGSKGCWLIRWKELIGSSGHTPSVRSLVRLMLLGLFFNNFLPSSVGGDVARGVGLAAQGVPRATAAASVLGDRIVGLFALALTGAFGAMAGMIWWPDRGPWGLGVALSAATALALGVAFQPRTIAVLGSLPLFAGDSRVARKARRLLEAGGYLADRKGALRRALLLSLGLSAFSTIYHWGIGRALGISVPLAAYCVIVPAVMLFSSLPITLNGLGVREVGFVGMLAAQGVPGPEATVFALLAFLGTLGFAVAGGILFLTGERRPLAWNTGDAR